MSAAFDELVLGQSHEAVNVQTRAEQYGAVLTLARQARRSIEIFSRDLDRKLFDQRDFLEALQILAVNHGQIRILVKNSSAAVKYGHRLIPLSQRLTTFIQIRKAPEDYRDYNEAFLIADGIGCSLRRHADRFEGSVHFNAAKTCHDLLTFFNQVWSHSDPDPDLQRLYL